MIRQHSFISRRGVALGLDRLGVGRLGARAYANRLSRRAGEGAVEDFVNRAFTPQTPPEGYLAHVGAPLALRAQTLQANADDLGRTHNALAAQAPRYRNLHMPVEIVHGGADWLLAPERHAQGLAEAVPQANLVVAQGVGHMAHHARPDLLAEAIERIVTATG